jgi:hypothetical protein
MLIDIDNIGTEVVSDWGDLSLRLGGKTIATRAPSPQELEAIGKSQKPGNKTNEIRSLLQAGLKTALPGVDLVSLDDRTLVAAGIAIHAHASALLIKGIGPLIMQKIVNGHSRRAPVEPQPAVASGAAGNVLSPEAEAKTEAPPSIPQSTPADDSRLELIRRELGVTVGEGASEETINMLAKAAIEKFQFASGGAQR